MAASCPADSSGEPLHVRELLRTVPQLLVTTASGGRAGTDAAGRLATLVASLTVGDVRALDRALRSRSTVWRTWFSARRLRGALPRAGKDHRDVFLALALAHPSGYVREAAVRRIWKWHAKKRRVPPLLAHRLLVLRRNDWVPEVAQAAADVLDRLLEDDEAASWVAALPLVMSLADTSRNQHGSFIQAVESRVCSNAWESVALAALEGTDRAVARAVARVVLAPGRAVSVGALRSALQSEDPVLRLAAARAATVALPKPEREATLGRLESDRFMPIRREGMRLCEAWLPEMLDAMHRRMLFDRSRALRGLAQRALRAAGENPAAQYRGRLERGAASLEAAVLGLGETGTPDDAARVALYLGAPEARIRAAAIRSLERLAGDVYVERFLAALRDTSPRVYRAAATALRFRLSGSRLDRVVALSDEVKRPGARRVLLRLLLVANRWAALAPVIRAAQDPASRDSSVQLLQQWLMRYRGVVRAPEPRFVQAAREALATTTTAVPPALRSELEHILRTLPTP